MITEKIYLMGRARMQDLPEEIQDNIKDLLPRVNKLLEAFGEVRVMTSGYRRPEDNAAIPGAAKRSNHMIGRAADIFDKDGKFNKFCKANTKLLEELCLWCEERQGNWQHLQSVPPRSKKRWFYP